MSDPAQKPSMPHRGTLDVLMHVIDLLPNPVFVKDRQHLFVEANTALCELLGQTREALIGHSDYEFHPPELCDIFWESDDDVFNSKGKNVNHESVQNANGETLWVESQKSYFQTDDGTEYLVGILTDMTALVDIKARETALAEAEKKARASAKAKAEFLANMSHEIRTPMNGVMGMTQILSGTDLSPTQAELVGTLERSGNALLRLIDDILDFSKIEAGQLRLNPETFELRTMVDDVAALLGTVARDKGLDLIVKFAPGLPSHVVGDAGRLRQIMLNLIGNAIKFTSNGYVCVEIGGQFDGDLFDMSASVCDTGIGIAPEKLSVIFEKFEQADGSTTRLYGGTGLGLSIARDLGMLMGGTLTVTSELGKGSRFTLNVKLPAETQSLTGSLTQVAPATDRLKILVVDDIALNLDIIKSQLNEVGLVADTASSSKMAIERLVGAENAGDPYTLLIIDFRLSNMDRLKLARSLRRHERFSDLEIVVMSSVNKAAVKNEFATIGVDNYLVKPVALTGFNHLISEVSQRLAAA